MNGGGALRRQIEHDECGSLSQEQYDPATSFLLQPGDGEGINVTHQHPWHFVSAQLHDLSAISAVEAFAHTSARSHGSYVWPDDVVDTSLPSVVGGTIVAAVRLVRLSRTLRHLYSSLAAVGENVEYPLVHYHIHQAMAIGMTSTAAMAAATDCDFGDGSAGGAACGTSTVTGCHGSAGDWRNFTLQKRALISLSPTVSNRLLLRMTENLANVATEAHQQTTLMISRPYSLCTELPQLMQAFDLSRNMCDGVLLLRARHKSVTMTAVTPLPSPDTAFVYEKVKLRQTVELAISWDRNTLATGDDQVFATKSIGNTVQRQLLYNPPIVATTSNSISVWHCPRMDGGELEIHGLPTCATTSSSSCNRRIVELEFLSVGKLRFVRWRPDKDVPDFTKKTLSVLQNKQLW